MRVPTMRRRIALTALTILAAIPAASHAQYRPSNSSNDSYSQRWVQVAEAASGTKLYMDKQTMTRDGNRVTVWVEHRYDSPQSDALGDGYTSYMVQSLYNCAARTSGLGTWGTHDAQGNTLKAGDFSNHEPTSVMPGTVDETIFNAVCKR